MTKQDSSRKLRGSKPEKPHPDYPLTPHNNGQWCKKILGRVWFFGKWDDPQAALDKYLDWKDDILAGRDPRQTRSSGVKLIDLVNECLTDRKHKLMAGANISQEHFQNLHDDCARLLDCLGKKTTVQSLSPTDFGKLRTALADGVSPKTLEGRIARIRSVFAYGIENELFDSVRWGNKFKKPDKAQLDRDRNLRRERHGKYAFAADQLRLILDHARLQVRAMTLLGIQGGFQNADCVELSINAIHFDAGEIRMVRRKTGAWRVVPMWPETAAAMRDVIAHRPTPNQAADDHLAFVTKYGNKWHRDNISQEFKKLLVEIDVYRPGLTFAALRKTFRTVADGAGDQPAAYALMGHSMGDISDRYREEIPVDRLRAVTNHVRQWLFGANAGE